MANESMRYETFAPPAELAPFVDCFWVLTGTPRPGDIEPEVVLPDGKTELIVHFGDPFLKLEGQAYLKQAPVLLSGQLTERILLKPSGAVGIAAARFHPAGPARFFALEFESIVDQVVDFRGHEPELADDLLSRIVAAASSTDRVAILRTTLMHLLSRESEEDVYVRQACRHIMQSGGDSTVGDIVKVIGFSERQLERKFKRQVGVGVKTLLRIARFQRFIAMANGQGGLTLADAALSCGYFDQAHFIRDFAKFSGVSPLTYLRAAHEMSDHFTKPV